VEEQAEVRRTFLDVADRIEAAERACRRRDVPCVVFLAVAIVGLVVTMPTWLAAIDAAGAAALGCLLVVQVTRIRERRADWRLIRELRDRARFEESMEAAHDIYPPTQEET